MPKYAKWTPTKYCLHCGTAFVRGRIGKAQDLECVSNYLRRKFCSLSCSVYYQHAHQSQTPAASRKRAQRFIEERCSSCGTRRELVVHHVNAIPQDNRPENLQTLCVNCHSFWHGLLKRIGQQPTTPMPPLILWQESEPTEILSSLN